MLKTRLNFVLLLLMLNSQLFPQTRSPSSGLPDPFQNRFERPFALCRIISDPEQATETKIASDNDSLLITLSNGRIKSINPTNEEINWETDLGGQVVSPPYLFGEHLIIVSKAVYETGDSKNKTDKTIVRLVNKNNGLVEWQIALEINPDGNIVSYGFGDLLVIANAAGDFYRLDKTDGKISAHKNFRETLSAAPFFDKDRIVFGTNDRHLIEISAKTFEVIGKIQVSAAPAVVFAFQENLIWGDQSGKVSRLETTAKTGISREKSKEKKLYKQKWSLRVGGKISGITSFRKNVLFTSLDNYIYSVSAEDGEIVWKQRLSGRPAFQPFLTENHLIILTIGSPTALLIEAQSGRTVNKISIESENFFTGSPGESASLIFFPTIRGIFFYAPEAACRSTERRPNK